MPAQPIQTETASDYRPRIRQLRAQRVPERERDGRAIYYSRRHDVWIAVAGNPSGGYRLSFYRSCPCGG